ncbi:hypothetical protein AB0F81_16560 [Actinoplanes sp. NPDC024001]|uniref:hypothetical protein n=1 Tax=Actinoplanes sp. NPDC024001 TaxID=3154598 RepID=UPI0033E1E478
MRRWLPRTAAGWTIAIFGAMAALFGAVGLIAPDVVLGSMGFEVLESRADGDYTRVFLAASSMASLNMGVYYLVAAATEWRPFFRFTVPFRLLTLTVFSSLVIFEVAPASFLGVALWEGAGAVATGLALAYDAKRAPVRV